MKTVEERTGLVYLKLITDWIASFGIGAVLTGLTNFVTMGQKTPVRIICQLSSLIVGEIIVFQVVEPAIDKQTEYLNNLLNEFAAEKEAREKANA